MAALAGTIRKVRAECPACGDDIDVSVTFRRVVHTRLGPHDENVQISLVLDVSVDYDLEATGHVECFEVTQDVIDSVLALEAQYGEGGN